MATQTIKGKKVKTVERFNVEVEVEGHNCEIPVTVDFGHVKGNFSVVAKLSAIHATYDADTLEALLEDLVIGVRSGFKFAMKLKRAHDNGKNGVADNQATLNFQSEVSEGEPDGEFVSVREN